MESFVRFCRNGGSISLQVRFCIQPSRDPFCRQSPYCVHRGCCIWPVTPYSYSLFHHHHFHWLPPKSLLPVQHVHFFGTAGVVSRGWQQWVSAQHLLQINCHHFFISQTIGAFVSRCGSAGWLVCLSVSERGSFRGCQSDSHPVRCWQPCCNFVLRGGLPAGR